MILFMGLGLVATAILEVALIVRVAERVGGANTLLLLILFSAVGAGLVKHAGMSAVRRVRDSVRAGNIPTMAVVDGAMVMLAGALLLPPGFITGTLGLLLIIPPVRRLVGGLAADAIRVRVARRIPVVRRSGTTRTAGSWRNGPAGDSTTRSHRAGSRADIIDVEGEEIDLLGGAAEIGPVQRD